MDLITIVIPIYNVSKYLSKCLNSVINQTYSNLEIILVNDGSTDNSKDICMEFINFDNRIRYIEKTNGGLSSARNAGIDIANGKYICFIDSDDWVSSNFVEVLYRLIIDTDSQIACCGRIKVYDKKSIQYNLHDGVYQTENALKKLFLFDEIDTAAWDKMYDISLFNEVRYPIGRLYEDIPVTYKLISKATKICVTHQNLYFYLQRNSGISRSKFNEKKYDLILNLNEVQKFINEKFPNLIDSFDLFFLRYLTNLLLEMSSKCSFKKQSYKKFKSLWKKGLSSSFYTNYEKIKILLVRFKCRWIFILLKRIIRR